MKVPDSGMPDAAYWNSLFQLEPIIHWLDLPACTAPVVEIGCGYGTFTLPVARALAQPLHAIDIEADLLAAVQQQARNAGLTRVHFHHRDVITQGSGLADESISLVLLFNLLHSAHNAAFLQEAVRLLQPGGRIAVLHWRNDCPTPRGPAVHLRPTAAQIGELAHQLNLNISSAARLFPPYHWGLQLTKTYLKTD